MNRTVAAYLALSAVAATCTACAATDTQNIEQVHNSSVATLVPDTTSIPQQPTAPTEPPRSSPGVPPAGERTTAVMPEVVCMNLQDAQDRVQAAGVFFSRNEDATGAGRRQVWDRNWVVVAQDPAAGVPIGEGEAVLSVVKIGEPGDCA